MYGFRDHPNPMPCTRLSAERHGSSRYSTDMEAVQLTEHLFVLEPGILRLTLPLPTGPKHVHCYFLHGDDGWLLVHTGLGLMETPWRAILEGLDAPVLQGALDYAQCERVWGSEDWPERIAEWFTRHGATPAVAEELIESGHVFADFVRFVWEPTLVEPGDEVDGWRVLWVPGHADGHLA